MPGLRTLSLLLGVLVLGPAGALAWLGLRGAQRLEHDAERRVHDELRQAGEALTALARDTLAADAREAAARVRGLAPLAERWLPQGSPGRALADLRVRATQPAAEGAAAEVQRLLGPAFEESRLLLRVVDAATGRRLWPAPHADAAQTPSSAAESLLADLRGEAERLAFGGADPAAGLAVWEGAAERLARAGLGLRGETERALLASAVLPGAGAPASALAALEARHPEAALSALGRPYVLLVLRAALAGDPGARARAAALDASGRLDEVPLTALERGRLAALAGFPGRPPPDAQGPGFAVERAPLPAGLVLELVRSAGPAERGHAEEVLRDRWAPVGRAAGVELALPTLGAPPPGRRLLHRVGVPLLFGGSATATLSHRDEEALLAEAVQARRLTTLGVGSLLAVLALGLVLTRLALAREREARRLKDDFLANVSHELRTPLTSVCLHADLLAEGEDGPSRRAHAEVVRAEGARLAALVDDLLDFAALERGVRRLEPAPVDLGAAVEQASAPYRVLAGREGVTLETDAPAPGVAALADPHALARILANLLGNAWKHGRPSRDGAPGRIRVRLSGGPGGAAVEVEDDGPGIDPVERAALFERFRRGARAAGTRGVGLGLALSRDLARAMGGELGVVEGVPRTVFRLSLAPVPDLPPTPDDPPATP